MTVIGLDGHSIESAEEAATAAKVLIDNANHAEAYDLAERALEAFGEHYDLQYLSTLALAKMEATEQASRHYESYDIAAQGTEDGLALAARFKKDLALHRTGEVQVAALVDAAEAYESVFAITNGYFPAINAAQLYLWAGQARHASKIATRIIEELPTLSKNQRKDKNDKYPEYWEAVTRIEAHIIADRHEEIQWLVPDAIKLAENKLGLLSTAARSINRSAAAKNIDTAWLSGLQPGTVVHYCGHIIQPDGPFKPNDEARVRARIKEELDYHAVGCGYGSLAAGADILFAEELLARGAELHVILPFEKSEFIEQSVRPSGGAWVARFENCLGQATSEPMYATEDSYLGDDTLFAYAGRMAMGRAVQRARELYAPVRQIAVWDQAPPRGLAGTAIDTEFWARTSREQEIIDVPRPDKKTWIAAPRPSLTAKRDVRAMLFGDVKNFSKMKDAQLPAFVEHIVGAWTRVIARHHDAVRFTNTWGDAFYLVFDNAGEAAACALDLQDEMAKVNLAKARLPEDLALRIGGHLGPVYASHDPILGRTNFIGAQVSRAARMEPNTPPGLVYVTEQFAASIALEHGDAFTADYAGTRPTPKNYGDLKMFRLRRGA